MKTKQNSPRSPRKRTTASIPCPRCGGPTEVLRTSLGHRRQTRRKRNYVLRERRCLTPEEHRFFTEEHTKEIREEP